ncbi:MAG: hypothetical protein JNK11_20405 [Alphaproteobacteria bacterium]|nr:hypothetical protein [Alphaproteobacteria bacterium]
MYPQYGDMVEAIAWYVFKRLISVQPYSAVVISGKSIPGVCDNGQNPLEDILSFLCSTKLMRMHGTPGSGSATSPYYFIASTQDFSRIGQENFHREYPFHRVITLLVEIMNHNFDGTLTDHENRKSHIVGFEKILHCLMEFNLVVDIGNFEYRWTELSRFYHTLMHARFLRGNYIDYRRAVFPRQWGKLVKWTVINGDSNFRADRESSYRSISDSTQISACNAITVGRFDCAIELLNRESRSEDIIESTQLLYNIARERMYDLAPYDEETFARMELEIPVFLKSPIVGEIAPWGV